MNIPVMRVIVTEMHVVLSLLTVSVVHICSLAGGYFATFAPRLGSKLSVLMVSLLKPLVWVTWAF